MSSPCPKNDVPMVSDSLQLVSQDIREVEKNNCVLPTIAPVINVQSNTEKRSSGVDDDLIDCSNSQCASNTIQIHGMTPKQIILLKHQLTQYVQIVTQSYVLCTMIKIFFMYRRKLKALLVCKIVLNYY